MNGKDYLCPDCGTPHTLSNPGCAIKKRSSKMVCSDDSGHFIRAIPQHIRERVEEWKKEQPAGDSETIADYWLNKIRQIHPGFYEALKEKK